MADTTAAGAATPTATQTASVQPQASQPRMSITNSTQTAVAGGLGSAGVVVFLWNWYILPEGAPLPPMDIGTATAMALMLSPLVVAIEWVVKYIAGWLPMPPARNRRSS